MRTTFATLAGALCLLATGAVAQAPGPVTTRPGWSEPQPGRIVASAKDLKDELADEPKLERTWRTRGFGDVEWWTGTGNDTSGTTEVRNHYVVVQSGGRAYAFLLERAISGGGNSIWTGTSAKLRRASQLDRGARSYLWVEFDEVKEHSSECLGEDGSGPTGIMARTQRKVLRGFVLTLKGTEPVLIARDIPVMDSEEPAKDEAAQCNEKDVAKRDRLVSKAGERRSQIDVDMDADGRLVVKPRTTSVTPAQKPWVGTFAMPNAK